MKRILEPGSGTFELRRKRHAVQRQPIARPRADRPAATTPAQPVSSPPATPLKRT